MIKKRYTFVVSVARDTLRWHKYILHIAIIHSSRVKSETRAQDKEGDDKDAACLQKREREEVY